MYKRYWDSSQNGVSRPFPRLVVLAFFAPEEALSVMEAAVLLRNPENGIQRHSSQYRTHSESEDPGLAEAVAEKGDCCG